MRQIKNTNGRILSNNEEHGLPFAVRQLADLSSQVGIPIRVICAQQVNSRLLLGALTPEDPQAFAYEFADEFASVADGLFSRMTSIFDPSSEQISQMDYFVRAGFSAWNALPDFVRSSLAPDAGGIVLIVGDSFWNAFPWEILCCDAPAEAFLGLARPLVRWNCLTGSSFRQLVPAKFGDGADSASVVAPYDVPTMQVLEGACDEAKAVVDGVGYKNSYPGRIRASSQWL